LVWEAMLRRPEPQALFMQKVSRNGSWHSTRSSYHRRMSKPELIHRFLTARSPAPVCDDCLAEEAGVQPRNQVNPIARTLALTRDFDRAKGECSLCKNETKYVTWSVEQT
jgi:hypothetical protein